MKVSIRFKLVEEAAYISMRGKLVSFKTSGVHRYAGEVRTKTR